MKYAVEMKIRGEWQQMQWAGTLRMADLLAACLRKQWANFTPAIRIVDTDTGEVVELN